MLHGARILVAPLDWGLGHSTRCIPVIRKLLALGAEPVIGADRGPAELLRGEFPELEHVRIPGPEIRYGQGRSQLWSMARQFPAMLRSIREEHAQLALLAPRLELDAVISDQRFGLHQRGLPSVLITHQLFPFTPTAQTLMRRVNLRHIRRFDRCWVMDEPQAPGLAGELSHGFTPLRHVRYIGTASRMVGTPPAMERRKGVLAIISGPEPQRSHFEELLIAQLRTLPGDHMLVQGKPGNTHQRQEGHVTVVPHLPAQRLAEEMQRAEHIVTRSGYTTLMDLDALGRSALLVPTPGQREQEYLGELHHGIGRFVVQAQHQLDLRAGIERLRSITPRSPAGASALLDVALRDLASILRSARSVTFDR